MDGASGKKRLEDDDVVWLLEKENNAKLDADSVLFFFCWCCLIMLTNSWFGSDKSIDAAVLVVAFDCTCEFVFSS